MTRGERLIIAWAAAVAVGYAIAWALPSSPPCELEGRPAVVELDCAPAGLDRLACAALRRGDDRELSGVILAAELACGL